MHCSHCGQLNNSDSNFCYICGSSLKPQKNEEIAKEYSNTTQTKYSETSYVPTCDKCNTPLTLDTKKSFFLGFLNNTCNKCKNLTSYQLSNGYRASWWLMVWITGLGLLTYFIFGIYVFSYFIPFALVGLYKDNNRLPYITKYSEFFKDLLEKRNNQKRSLRYRFGIPLLALIIVIAMARMEHIKAEVNDSSTEVNLISNSRSHRFNSVEGRFSITFPSKPGTERENIDLNGESIEFVQYISQPDADHIYMVQYVNYPQSVDTSNPKANLEGAMNGVINNLGSGTLLNSRFVSYYEYPAIDFTVRHIYKGLTMHGKYRGILNGQELYLIAVMESDSSSAEFDTFVNSFQLNESI